MSLFQTLRQSDIAARIGQATTFVAYVAPGVSDAVADALIKAHGRLSDECVVVVLDVSAASARAGYGVHQAVCRVQGAGMTVRTEPRLRLGLLICDAEGWAFSIPPRMIEDEVREAASAPNAVVLTPTQVIALRAELASCRGSDPVTTPIASIGARAASESLLRQVGDDLERNPPQPFDLSRQVHVFDSAIEFVELALEGWRIGSRKIRMPKELPILAGGDAELNRRIESTFHLVESTEGLVLKALEARFNELRDAYLRPMGKYLGRVLIRSKRKEFDAKLADLRAAFEKAKETLEASLQKALDANVDDLVGRLAAIILSMPNPPLKFQARFRPDKAGATRYVREQLESRIPRAKALVEGMKVHVIVKGVTLEMLKDEEFQRRFFEQVPREELAVDLYAEYDTAKARFDANLRDKARKDPGQ